MATDIPAAQIDTLRAFNRFYTRRIGVLDEKLLASKFSLAESRLLWELAHREPLTATALAAELRLDAGYLSRLIARFKERGLLRAEPSLQDARARTLSLTPAGRRAFAPIDTRSRDQAQALLATLPAPKRERLLDAMATIGDLLDDGPAAPRPWLLRPHRAGDIGWIVSRHGALYAAEYGWDLRFEALVARIAADFVDRFEPALEACWIAERDGVNLGCVMLVQARDETTQAPRPGTAQLRLLLVEPGTRGLGIGARLVAECTRFAREAGYEKIVLWTNSILLAARAIYTKQGYRLTASEPHESFGHALVGETWELPLR